MKGKVCSFLLCCICIAAFLWSPASAYPTGAAAEEEAGPGSVNIEWDNMLFTFECSRIWDAESHQYVEINRQRQSNILTLRVSREGGGLDALSVLLRFSPGAENCFDAVFSSDNFELASGENSNEVLFLLPEGGTGSISIQLLYTGDEASQESLMGRVGSVQVIPLPAESQPVVP